MEFNIKVGLKKEMKKKVENTDTAAYFGSGGVDVLATPVMIGLMEGVCLNLMDENLPEDHTTVGTLVNVKHISATPVGMEVIIKVELKEIDRKKLVFDVEAFDEKEKIGEGKHERFIINKNRFMEKVNSKRT